METTNLEAALRHIERAHSQCVGMIAGETDLIQIILFTDRLNSLETARATLAASLAGSRDPAPSAPVTETQPKKRAMPRKDA